MAIIRSQGITIVTSIPTWTPENNESTFAMLENGSTMWNWNGVSWEIFAPPVIENAAVIKTIEFNLTAADIISMFNTPVLVIPGEVGKIHQIINCTSVFTYGGVQYTGGGILRIVEETSLISQAGTLSSAVLQGVSNYIQAGSGSATNRLSGKGLLATNSTAPFAAGNGTVKHIITYITITL